jgi:DNA polymerase-3 subunit epsilon
MDFVAIDFETATGRRDSACAVGIVTVKDGEIADKYYSLIQPPGNVYNWMNVNIHGIRPADTACAPVFEDIYPEIRERLMCKTVVAHNEVFDRSVLRRTMEYYSLDYSDLQLAERWECTMRIYKKKGFAPCRLNACCERLGIELNHHEALSDALACAKLFLAYQFNLNTDK